LTGALSTIGALEDEQTHLPEYEEILRQPIDEAGKFSDFDFMAARNKTIM
jgi:hypothetical protein